MADNVRIDKFLWAVRIYKTRSVAAEALKRGKVMMGGSQVKSSKTVKVGDEFSVKVPAALRTFRIIKLAQSRMGAKLVKDHIEEVTPKDQLELIDLYRLQMSMQRRRGLGRPTKKERRDLDQYFDSPADAVAANFDFDDYDELDGFDDEFDDEMEDDFEDESGNK